MRLGTLPQTQSSADEFARSQGMSSDSLTLVENFKSRVVNFSEAMSNLRSRRIDQSRHPDLAAEQRDLLSRGSVIQRTIENLTSAVDKVFAFFKGVTGMDGLGIIPLLPIAAITIGVAAITKWTTGVYEFSRRADVVEALEAKGYSPERAAQIADKQMPGSSLFAGFGDIGTLLPWLAVAGVVFFILKGGKIK